LKHTISPSTCGMIDYGTLLMVDVGLLLLTPTKRLLPFKLIFSNGDRTSFVLSKITISHI